LECASPLALLHRLCHGRSIFFALLFLFSTLLTQADPTNTLSGAEVQGRALVGKILAQPPASNCTNSGVLLIRSGSSPRLEIPVEFKVFANPANWQAVYSARFTNQIDGTSNWDRTRIAELVVIHAWDQRNLYKIPNPGAPAVATNSFGPLTDDQLMLSFAGSDFALGDLGLEFFHWPQQKVVKREFHRQCACMVLESTNPDPSASGYSRVVSWIDEDSLGIVEAYAYDVNGRKLKNFYPKNFEKVNGAYQVESMVMENLQTGSRSTFEFDLH
jgi:hypothetical protein